jgi:hypothetical protein
MTALVLLLLAQNPAWDNAVFTNPGAWKGLEKGAVTVEGREISPGPYSEYRVTTETTQSLESLCVAVFEWGTHGKDNPGTKVSTLLKDGEDERVVYNQIEQPVVSNRDYAMTVMRRREAVDGGDPGVCRIRFVATNELAPAKPDGIVRMDRMWGSWTFERLESGKTRVTYTLFADPAGSIPPFLVHGAQRSAAKDSVAQGLAKAKARGP